MKTIVTISEKDSGVARNEMSYDTGWNTSQDTDSMDGNKTVDNSACHLQESIDFLMDNNETLCNKVQQLERDLEAKQAD